MPGTLDVQRLIAEIKKRPALWDVHLPEYKDRSHSAHLWQEVSNVMDCDVELCKRKWKNLRDAYRAEVRRSKRRIESLKLEGQENPQVIESKWNYFIPMSFMNDSKRKRHSYDTENDRSNDSHSNDAHTSEEHIDMDNVCDVKMEPLTISEDEADKIKTSLDSKFPTLGDDDDDEEANDLLFEQFKSVATPQAARRLSNTLTKDADIDLSSLTHPTTVATSTSNVIEPIAASSEIPIVSQNSTCKCPQREDQVHFLEDLEREEQQLMKSTKRDITRANSLNHFGDSDYNFLVSFLPQLKRLSPLQNLQFRARMSDLMLRIAAQPIAPATTIHATNFKNMQATTVSCQQGHSDCKSHSNGSQHQQQSSLS